MVGDSPLCQPFLTPTGIPGSTAACDCDWWLRGQNPDSSRLSSCDPEVSPLPGSCLVLHYYFPFSGGSQVCWACCLLYWHSRCYVTVPSPADLCLFFLGICLVSYPNTVSTTEASVLVVSCRNTNTFLGRHLCVVFIAWAWDECKASYSSWYLISLTHRLSVTN